MALCWAAFCRTSFLSSTGRTVGIAFLLVSARSLNDSFSLLNQAFTASIIEEVRLKRVLFWSVMTLPSPEVSSLITWETSVLAIDDKVSLGIASLSLLLVETIDGCFGSTGILVFLGGVSGLSTGAGVGCLIFFSSNT